MHPEQARCCRHLLTGIALPQRIHRERNGHGRFLDEAECRESLRCDTDDCERAALKPNGLTNDGAVAAVLPLPKSVSEDRDGRRRKARQVHVVCSDQSARSRSNAEFSVEVASRGQGQQLLQIVADFYVGPGRSKPDQVGEDTLRSREGLEHRHRHTRRGQAAH
jgi:hypothetical protein